MTMYADAIAMANCNEKPAHEIYHLSSGVESETFAELTNGIGLKAQGKKANAVLGSSC